MFYDLDHVDYESVIGDLFISAFRFVKRLQQLEQNVIRYKVVV